MFASDSNKRLPLYHMNSDYDDDDKYHKYKVNKRDRYLRIFYILIVIIVINIIIRITRSAESATETTTATATATTSPLSNNRSIAIRNSFIHSYSAYKQYALPHDTLRPLSHSYEDWFSVALTLIDSLDTAILMNYTEPLDDALSLVPSIVFNSAAESNVFELTIRVLGGLESAYYLTKNEIFLQKSKELGDLLLVCFNTRYGLPLSSVVFSSGECRGSLASTSEVSSIQLEFKYLSQLTGDERYSAAVDRVMDVLLSLRTETNLVPIYISTESGKFESKYYRLGSRADSYYEYLFKLYLMTGEERFKEAFEEAVDEMIEVMVRRTKSGSGGKSLLYLTEYPNGLDAQDYPKMDHLVCYLPGTVLLYLNTTSTSPYHSKFLSFASDLLDTCIEMYSSTATGLAPEIVHFNDTAMYIKPQDAFNILRPETVESLWYFYLITRDEKYREVAWMIFESFEKYCRVVDGGYSGIDDVDDASDDDIRRRDKMESFWMAETLKYFYLIENINSSSTIRLDEIIFNTEAHLIPIMNKQE